MLWIIGAERCPDQVVIQKIDIMTGEYLLPKVFNGSCAEAVRTIPEEVYIHRPSQIIFDTFGKGIHLKSILLELFKNEEIKIDERGFVHWDNSPLDIINVGTEPLLFSQ